MNPIFNQKYKTTLCRHWQTSGSCSIGVRCVFAHGEAELRNPEDPITINQNILTDPKMLSSFMSNPLGDMTHINAMVTAQQLQALKQQTMHLQRALRDQSDQDAYKNTLTAAKQYMNKPHFDITEDPAVKKRLETAQMKYLVNELLKLELHPIIKCKVKICKELLEAQNLNSCAIILDQIMERSTAPQHEKYAYEKIIDKAGQLAIELIAEEKVKYMQMQRDQEMLIRKQYEKTLEQGKNY